MTTTRYGAELSATIEIKDCKGEEGASHPTWEEAMAAAQRELLEETGYESGEWRHLLTIPSNATIADNYAHIFEARNCRKVSGQDLDETEFIDIVKESAETIDEMIKMGDPPQS